MNECADIQSPDPILPPRKPRPRSGPDMPGPEDEYEFEWFRDMHRDEQGFEDYERMFRDWNGAKFT